METAMPTLDAVLKQVEKFVDEESKHHGQPHIIDVILPMLCSYLPFWWNQGPDNVNPSEGSVQVTSLVCPVWLFRPVQLYCLSMQQIIVKFSDIRYILIVLINFF